MIDLFYSDNGTVHRAAANDADFRTRAARGSVCNGLLFRISFCVCKFNRNHFFLIDHELSVTRKAIKITVRSKASGVRNSECAKYVRV
jgi:hypothetical protein